MPQAAPIVASAIIAGLATASVPVALATLALGFVSYAMQQQAMKDLQKDLRQQGHLINTRSTQSPIPIVYGRMRVGGNQVYLSATGTNNEYLHIVQSLAEGPVYLCEKVYLDDKDISTFGSDAYYEFYRGTPTQGVCQSLKNADLIWNDPLRYTAYLYLRLRYNPDKFLSLPNITAVLKGREVYDPRSQATTWSDNPALCIYDFMTNARYGMGIPSEFIDENSVIDTANWLDTKGYKLNGAIVSQDYGLDILQSLLTGCRCVVIWSGGKFKFKPLDYDAPVMSFDEDNIVEPVKFSVPSLQKLPNTVRIKYANANNNFTFEDILIQDTTAINLDGETREYEVTLLGVTDYDQARKIGTYLLERLRNSEVCSFVTGPQALPLEAGDMIEVSYRRFGWTKQRLRAMQVQLLGDHNVALTCALEDPAFYDDTLNVVAHGVHTSTLPDPSEPPDEATNVTFTEEEYYNKDTSYTRLKISFTPPQSPFWAYSEVWVKVNNAAYVHYANVRNTFTIEPVEEGAVYKIKLVSVSLLGIKQDLLTATEWTYTVQGKNTPPDDVQNFRAIPQSDTIILNWDPVNNVDLLGYEIRKGTNWNGGIFVGFTRALTFQINGVPPGTHSYMIKSVDTNGKYSTNFALATATVYGPASYVEKMSEYDDFSELPTWQASTSYSVGDRVIPTTPNGYYYECIQAGTSSSTEPTWPTGNGQTITDGTVVWKAYEDHQFQGTELYVDPTYGNLLRVNRGGTGNLSGTYLSRVYDRGSTTTRRAWVLYDVLFSGTGTTWADQFTSTDLWTDRFSSTDTWLDLFGQYIAGTLTIELGYSTDGTSWTWVKNFESYAAEVQARYVRFRINIQDENTDGYLEVKPITYKEAYWQ